ncbi:MAG: hypothetical protein ACUVXJ_19115 [Phycisphaerae bacterium]
MADVDALDACACGPGTPLDPGCENQHFDHDNDVDQPGFAVFQRCYSGADVSANAECAD